MKWVRRILISWFLLYATLTLYPWYSEGLFWGFAQQIRVGASESEIRHAVNSRDRSFRLVGTDGDKTGKYTNCIVCTGTVDPPRRLYLLMDNSSVVDKNAEVAQFNSQLESAVKSARSFRWYLPYASSLGRSAICCSIIYFGVWFVLRKHSRLVTILAVIPIVLCGLLLVVDAAWLGIIYARYIIMWFLGGQIGC